MYITIMYADRLVSFLGSLCIICLSISVFLLLVSMTDARELCS